MLQDSLDMPKFVGLGICAVGAYIFRGFFKRHCSGISIPAYTEIFKKKLGTLRSFAIGLPVNSGLPLQVQNAHLEVNRVRQIMQRPPVRDIAIQAGRQPSPDPQQHPAHIHWRMAEQIARMGRERDAHIATINHLRLELRLAYRYQAYSQQFF